MRHTNPIAQYRVANVLDQTAQFIGILDVVEKNPESSLALTVALSLDGRLPIS